MSQTAPRGSRPTITSSGRGGMIDPNSADPPVRVTSYVSGWVKVCDGARSVVVGVPSPNDHRNSVSSGEPTGENDSVSGADPRQRAVAGSYDAHPVTAMSIVNGLGVSLRGPSIEAS